MLKKIPVSKVRPGMFIQKLGDSWLTHPFWRGSFLLEKADDLAKIRKSGIAEVWIDPDRGLDGPDTQSAVPDDADPMSAPPDKRSDDAEPAIARVSVAAELGRARRLYEGSKVRMRAMFAEARLGRAIDTEGVQALVEEISASVQRNPWALITVARLKTADEYTYMHSVAVCALMIALARQLGLPEHETREIGTAGLFHDIGKAQIPAEILNKPGKLTDEEFAIVKTHPRLGWELLRRTVGIGEITLDVCLHHHEKMDGTGYPDRLSSDAISLHARMGAVCDIYDAVTSNRPYKKGWDPAESLRNMAQWTKGHLDERVFGAFVKSVGIYPVGSLVRLESGLLGVVVDQAESSLLTPRVRAFFSAKSRAYVQPRLIDLASPSARDRISGPEDPTDWGITDIEAYWR